jgi:hypothetical protein
MDHSGETIWTAFQQGRAIGRGTFADIAPIVKAAMAADGQASVLVFDDTTGRQVDLDLDNPPRATAEPRGPGRPKLGVVAREVTLLPRHWEWLNGQRGGASVALRRLVDEARAATVDVDQRRRAQEVADRFMSVMAGDLQGYEAASRALYASDQKQFMGLSEQWPADIRDHARRLAAPAFVALAPA